jgi:hypothetical protein
LAVLATLGCQTAYRQSVGAGDPPPYVSRIFLTDFNVAWQSILDALKHSPLDVSNREGGFVQTKWTDNTAERNFVDSFGLQDTYLKAQYRFRVTVAKGFYNGQASVRVQVHKDQLVERDVLEGWRHAADEEPTDENTLLYRIGRLINMKMKLGMLEEQKTKESLPPPADTSAPPPPADNAAPEIQPEAPPPADTSAPPAPAPESKPAQPSKESKELDILESQ